MVLLPSLATGPGIIANVSGWLGMEPRGLLLPPMYAFFRKISY